MSPEFETYIQTYKTVILKHMLDAVPERHPALLYEPMRYALQVGGKLLRPILSMVCCEAVGGATHDALNAAVALELVHNFSLVHDDIMDNDELRRGRQTVHKKWDTNVAILSGDAILIKAFDVLSNVDPKYLPRVLKEFNQGILEVCEGQTLDMEFEERHDVSLEEYFYMIDRKTAKLFSLSCELGAILGGGTEVQIQAMRTYGKKLGRAFQIQDDLLDLLSDEITLGKDVGSDIIEDKKTFLILYTREHGSKEQLTQLKRLVRKADLSPNDLKIVILLLNEIGTIDAARAEIKQALEDARLSLNKLTHPKPKQLLSNLLDILKDRTY